jgi:hypothetical protein
MAKHEHRKHEYPPKDGMIDNRMVHDNHQEGIERVKQRKSERMRADCEGHYGSMAGGWKHEGRSESHFARKGGSLTPRKA